jgi:hypothetical protein
MPKSAKKKPPQTMESMLASLPGIADRPGLPAKDSIVAVTLPAAAMAPGAVVTQYAFIHTNEMDEYGEDAEASSPAAAAAALPAGDDFKGTDRKAAKLSVSTAKTEKFKDVKTLISSLAPEAAMKNHKPAIAKGAKSNRVKEEQRNVHVTAFMYAVSREADNDFHLIIGRDPKAAPDMYMTMELSGLPPSNSPAFAQLSGARDAFKQFFSDHGDSLPGAGYVFPHPPVPVEIDGSLFFDMTHATGSRPGPKSLKSRMPVIWEVHPITKIVLK